MANLRTLVGRAQAIGMRVGAILVELRGVHRKEWGYFLELEPGDVRHVPHSEQLTEILRALEWEHAKRPGWDGSSQWVREHFGRLHLPFTIHGSALIFPERKIGSGQSYD